MNTTSDVRKNFKFDRKMVALLMDTVPSYIAVVDADGTLKYGNRELLRFLGVDGDFIKKAPLNVRTLKWATEDGCAVSEEEMPFLKIIREKTAITGLVYSLKLPGREAVFFSINGAPFFDAKGAVVGVVFSLVDIDRLINADRQLREKNEELSVFAHTLAHDMKSPLTNILNYAELLAIRHAGALNEDANEIINYITRSAKSAYVLQKDLMAYLTVKDGGKLFSAIDLEVLVDGIINDVRISMPGAVIRRTSLPRVVALNVHMFELFQNLIGNAVKFTRPGTAPEVSISVSEKDGDCVFSIADNGIGIEEKYLDKLFNLFVRLHSDSEFPGTGIGLVICKKITAIYGGTIRVESAPGKGTVLYFTLPRAMATQACEPPAP